ncbi:MAG: ABC transporter ATP-binding protein [Proteobacteria bacterium]|nr:ABC transporter ATP-binding protein [Pseudomonadota bacterium]
MSSEAAVSLRGISKCFPIYAKPGDRLRQFLFPPVARVAGAKARNYYDEYWALRDVSFEVFPGEQIGIVGRNGAGKSTLLQIICGTLKPTTGTVDVRGRVAALLELGAGFNPELTGAENIYLNGSVLGLTNDEIAERYDSIVAFADIPGFIDQPVKQYSSGMYMRLAFAVAVHVEPDILVVDEALSVGDEAYQRKCHARIRKLRDNGATILFVSHSAGHVTEVCDRAVLIDRGEVLAMGTPKSVVSRYQKLLYARTERQDEIRASLLDDYRGGVGSLDTPALPAARRAVAQPGGDEAYWDAGLVSQSVVDFPSRGCIIKEPGIFTISGERVNVLRPDEDYLYKYQVCFDRDAVGVRFGMMVKTKAGVELAGWVSHPEDSPLPHVVAGSTYEVSIRFRNVFNADTYFMNAGVAGMDGEHETYLARAVDVVMFRSMRVAGSLATGFINFQGQASWEADR